MNTRKYMIVIKGEIRTPEIVLCRYNAETKKMDVTFENGKKYSYAYSNVKWMKDPKVLDPNMYHISNKEGRELFHIKSIYVFQDSSDAYWHICFENGSERDYRQSELNIVKSCLNQKQASDVMQYLRQIAGLCDLKNETNGERLLKKKFEKISFVGENAALAKYLDPDKTTKMALFKSKAECIPIFPFGCNNSQYQAVKNAMENQISVIQGPPGTGKTQTILNIIANILMQGKTVLIVSNNNSATENVYEKLASPKYGLGFVVAALGNSKNKKEFIKQQNTKYPNFSDWKSEMNSELQWKEIQERSQKLKTIFDKQERLASLRQEYDDLITEQKYFEEFVRDMNANKSSLRHRKNISSSLWLDMWRECQKIPDNRKRVGLLFILRSSFRCGNMNLDFYHQDITQLITGFQAMFYQTRENELKREIEELDRELSGSNKNMMEDLSQLSMNVLKNRLAEKYEGRIERKVFSEDSLRNDAKAILREYPVILSTTFSSRDSLNADIVYDYLIMDEASQVDIATGALALSCAKNAVIVGDIKQLPNVVTEDIKLRSQAIFNSFKISEGYQFTNSFLQSVLDIMPDVSQVMLREHYRCHPKIINFCNQKFYRGELVVMTTDHGEKDVLTAVKTVPGNHARNHYSQRQIDVIKQEIMPEYDLKPENTGIIAPYKNQVEALEKEVNDIDIATVHKFQGREKDNIIISTVDDEISDFADDPYLINVAVSRAKKKLILVTTGNEQKKERNITDLINYIQYHNFEVVDSKVYSIFDYLYKQNMSAGQAYMKKYNKISKYDSENLMNVLLQEILQKNEYSNLALLFQYPMRSLIRRTGLLSQEEYRYVENKLTHIDFLLYNKIGKQPVLAIEVDGYQYHKEGTQQAVRDTMKDHILELYGIPFLRLKTNGSSEKERIIEKLDQILGK